MLDIALLSSCTIQTFGYDCQARPSSSRQQIQFLCHLGLSTDMQAKEHVLQVHNPTDIPASLKTLVEGRDSPFKVAPREAQLQPHDSMAVTVIVGLLLLRASNQGLHNTGLIARSMNELCTCCPYAGKNAHVGPSPRLKLASLLYLYWQFTYGLHGTSYASDVLHSVHHAGDSVS